MEDCLARNTELWTFAGFVRQIFYPFYRFLVFSFAAARKDEDIQQRIIHQETINQQAARMLTDYGNAVLRLAYSYLHNKEDAEEILQDTLMQFIRKKPTLKTTAHEKAWLLHVAANLSKNRMKYNGIRQTDELMEELASEKKSDLSFVWEAVKALPEKYRATVHLFYYEGYKTAQIAKILDMKESTVRSNLARGREKLKAALKEGCDFE